MPTKLEELAVFGISNWAEGIADHSLGKRAAYLDRLLREIVSDTTKDVSHISGDTNLSDAGRKAKKGKLGLESLDRIAKVESEIPQIEEWVNELGASLAPSSLAPSDSQVDFLLEQEIRSLIREVPEMERSGILFNAISQGDTPTIRAFYLGPKAFPLTIPDAMEQGKIMLIERSNPKTSAEHKAAVQALDALKNGVEAAKRSVSTQTGIATDTLMKMAG